MNPGDQGGVGRRLRWQPWHTVVLLSSLGWVFMYADRTVLSPVLPLIGGEWSLDQSQLGLIASLFFLAYTALQVPVGMLADRLGRHLILLVPGLLLLAVGTLLSGLAPTYGFLLAASVIAGLGQSTYYPTQFALSTAVVPVKFRSVSAAIINSGQAVGISLGLLIASYFALELGGGWRLPFIALALPTALIAVAFWVFIREPGRSTSAPGSGETSAAAPSATEARVAGTSSPWSRNHLLIYLLNFCSLYGFFVILTWLPYYLQTARGYDGMAVGWISSLVPWMAVPGGLFASWLSDRLQLRREVGLWMLPVAGLALAAIPFIQSHAGLVAALLFYGVAGKLALDPVVIALVADITDRSVYGTVFGVLNFAGMSSSIAAPFLTGLIADRTGSLSSGFYFAAALLAVGFLALAFVKRQPTQAAQLHGTTT